MPIFDQHERQQTLTSEPVQQPATPVQNGTLTPPAFQLQASAMGPDTGEESLEAPVMQAQGLALADANANGGADGNNGHPSGQPLQLQVDANAPIQMRKKYPGLESLDHEIKGGETVPIQKTPGGFMLILQGPTTKDTSPLDSISFQIPSKHTYQNMPSGMYKLGWDQKAQWEFVLIPVDSGAGFVHVEIKPLDRPEVWAGIKAYLQDNREVKIRVTIPVKGGKEEKEAPTEAPPTPGKFEVNAWPADIRFKRDEIKAQHAAKRKAPPTGKTLPDRLSFYGSPTEQAKSPDHWTISIQRDGFQTTWLMKSREDWKKADAAKVYENIMDLAAKMKEKGGKGGEGKGKGQSEGGGKPGPKYPYWVRKLRQKLTETIDGRRESNTDPTQYPSKITIEQQGADYYFRIWVEKSPEEGQAEDKTRYMAGLVPFALHQGLLSDPTMLANAVQKLCTILHNKETITEQQASGYEKVILPPYPARIVSQNNLGSSWQTIKGAELKYRMALQLEAYHGSDLLNLASIAKGSNVYYDWAVCLVPVEYAAQAADIRDWKKRREFLKMNAHKFPIHKSISGTDEPKADWEHSFTVPDFETDLVIYCKATHVSHKDEAQQRAPSESWEVLNVTSPEALADPLLDKDLDKKTALEQRKAEAEAKGDTEAAGKLQKEIDKIGTIEKGSLQMAAGAKISDTEKLLESAKTLRKLYRKGLGDGDMSLSSRLLEHDLTNKTSLLQLKNMLLAQNPNKGLGGAIEAFIKSLNTQISELKALQGRADVAEKSFKPGQPVYRPQVVMILNEGQRIPLQMVLGHHPESDPDNEDKDKRTFKFILYDVTHGHFKRGDNMYVGEASKGVEDAWNNAFEVFAEETKYGSGTVHYRVPPGTIKRKLKTKYTLTEFGEDLAMVAGMAALMAAVMASGGTLAPAVGAAAVALGVGSAVLGGALAGMRIADRSEKGTLWEEKTELYMDALDIVGAIMAGVTAGTSAMASRALQAGRSLSRINRVLAITQMYDMAEMGMTIYLINEKLEEDLRRIEEADITDDQKKAFRDQVLSEAVMAGTFLLYTAKGNLDDALTTLVPKVRGAAHATFRSRGWIDDAGNWTDKAPGFMKNKKAKADVESPEAEIKGTAGSKSQGSDADGADSKPKTAGSKPGSEAGGKPEAKPGKKSGDGPGLLATIANAFTSRVSGKNKPEKAKGPEKGQLKPEVIKFLENEANEGAIKQPGDDAKLRELLDIQGNWRDLISGLNASGKDYAYSVTKNLQRYRNDIVKVLEGKGAKAFGGSTEPVSDVDLSTSGMDAGANLIQLEKFMADKHGANWSEKLRMNFYSGAERMTFYEKTVHLMGKEEIGAMQKQFTQLSDMYNYAKMLHHAKGNPAAETQIRTWLFSHPDWAKIEALAKNNPPTDKGRRDALHREIDALVRKFETGHVTQGERKRLAIEITKKTIEVNYYTEEAYIGPGAGRMTVSGTKVVGPEAYQAAVSNLEMLFHILKECDGDVIKAAREYELFKYINRYCEAAENAGMSSPALTYFQNLSRHLYRTDRTAHAADAHKPEVAGKAKDEAKNPDAMGSRDTKVTDEWLKQQFDQFMDLVGGTHHKMRDMAAKNSSKMTAPKRAPATTTHDDKWKNHPQYKVTEPYLNKKLTSEGELLLTYMGYQVSWRGRFQVITPIDLKRLQGNSGGLGPIRFHVDQRGALRTLPPVARPETTRMGTSSRPGEAPSNETIMHGTVRMESHPKYDDVVKQIESKGFKVEFTEGDPHVSAVQYLDEHGKEVKVSRVVYLQKGMRFLDLEHELGHVLQLERMGKGFFTDRFKQKRGRDGQLRYRSMQTSEAVLTPWRNTITEFDNRLVEFLRLAERNVSDELLQEHADGIMDWKNQYLRKGIKGSDVATGGSRSRMEWADQHCPDIKANWDKVKQAAGKRKINLNEVKGSGRV